MCEPDQSLLASYSEVTNDGWVARNDDFAGIIQRQAGACTAKLSLTQLIDEHCQRHNIREDELASPRRTRRNAKIRVEIAITAQQPGIATLHEVAARFNRSDSALGHAVQHVLNARRRAK